MEHLVLSLTKSEWKLRQSQDQNFSMEEKASHSGTRPSVRKKKETQQSRPFEEIFNMYMAKCTCKCC